jgi:hypothetical protein
MYSDFTTKELINDICEILDISCSDFLRVLVKGYIEKESFKKFVVDTIEAERPNFNIYRKRKYPKKPIRFLKSYQEFRKTEKWKKFNVKKSKRRAWYKKSDANKTNRKS